MANRRPQQSGNGGRRMDFNRNDGRKNFGRSGVSPWQGGGPGAGLPNLLPLGGGSTEATLALASNIINLLQPRPNPVPSLLDMPIRRDFGPQMGRFDRGFMPNRMGNQGNFRRTGNYNRAGERINTNRKQFKPNDGPKQQPKSSPKKEADSKAKPVKESENQEDKKEEATDTVEIKEEDGKKDFPKTRYDELNPQLLKCHICNKSMWDGRSFENHLSGRAHAIMMQKTAQSYALTADTMRQEFKIITDYSRIHPHTASRTLPKVPRIEYSEQTNPYLQEYTQDAGMSHPYQTNRNQDPGQPNWNRNARPHPDWGEGSGSSRPYWQDWVQDGGRSHQFPPHVSEDIRQDWSQESPHRCYAPDWGQHAEAHREYSEDFQTPRPWNQPNWGENVGPYRRYVGPYRRYVGPVPGTSRTLTSPWVEDRRAATGPRGIREMKRHRRTGSQPARDFYCAMCDMYASDGALHRTTVGHRKLKKYLHPSCTSCHKEMPTRIELDEHRLTAEHLKNMQDKQEVVTKPKPEVMVISTLTMEQSYLRDDRQRKRRNDTQDDKQEDGKNEENKEGEENQNQDEIKTEPGTEEDKNKTTNKKVELDTDATILDYKEGDDLSHVTTEMLPIYNTKRGVGESYLSEFRCIQCRLCHKLLDSEETAQVHLRTWKHHQLFVKSIMPQPVQESAPKRPLNTDDNEGNWKRQKTTNQEEQDNIENGDESMKEEPEEAAEGMNDAEGPTNEELDQLDDWDDDGAVNEVLEDEKQAQEGLEPQVEAEPEQELEPEQEAEPEPVIEPEPVKPAPAAISESKTRGTPRGRGRGRARGRGRN